MYECILRIMITKEKRIKIKKNLILFMVAFEIIILSYFFFVGPNKSTSVVQEATTTSSNKTATPKVAIKQSKQVPNR